MAKQALSKMAASGKLPQQVAKKTKRTPRQTPAQQQISREVTASAMLETAVEIAAKLHRGQIDKYDQPYILHVLGVMGRCRTIEEKIVALLHDVVEDGHTTLQALRRRGFSARVIEAVDLLTRRKNEHYDAFVKRIAPNALARAVKLADLEDNMDIRSSIRPIIQKDAERMEKYRKA